MRAHVGVIPCRVCGDKSSGVHYGVVTCEGCKGFFRRSQRRGPGPACSRQQNCAIDRASRTRCPHCRLQKCLRLGMSRAAVKFGRMSKQQRERLQAEAQRQPEQGAPADPRGAAVGQAGGRGRPPTPPGTHGGGAGPGGGTHGGTHGGCLEAPATCGAEIELLTQSVLQAGRASCPLRPRRGDTFSGEETRAYQGKPMAEMWQRCAGAIAEAAQHVVEFAKGLRGFLELGRNDQIVLLKSGVMEVVLLRMSRAFDPESRTVLFEGKYAGAELFGALGCQQLVGSIFDWAAGLCALQLSEGELAFLCAIVLVDAERPWLQGRAEVARLRARLDIAFRVLLRRTRREGLLGRLPPPSRLRALCSQHVEQLRAFGRLHPGVLQAAFPPLYRELFAPEPEPPAAR